MSEPMSPQFDNITPIEGGAFQTARKIFYNELWYHVVEFRLFFLIYGKAVYKGTGLDYHGINLKRGQWVRSYRKLQDDLEYVENRAVKSYSLSRIKRAVDRLVKENRLKIEECELGTLFTVVNYESYQGLTNYKNNQVKQGWNGDGTGIEQEEKRSNKEKERSNKEKERSNKILFRSDSDESKPSRKISFTEDDLRLAQLLSDLMTTNNPSRKPTNDSQLKSWSNEARLMREQDKRSPEAIEAHIRFAQNDLFERTINLSTKSLRKNFDRLTLKMKGKNTRKPKNKSNACGDGVPYPVDFDPSSDIDKF